MSYFEILKELLRKHKWAFVLLLCVLVVICGMVFFKKSLSGDADKVVEIIKVEHQTITQRTRLIGTVQPRRSTVFSAKQAGTLNYRVESGTFVKSDTLIATLENNNLQNTYNLVQSAEKIAKASYDRTVELSKKSASSKKNVEQALVEWINAKKDLARIKIDLDKTLITAPFDGIVGSYKVHDGGQVSEGDHLVTFFQPDDLIVEFDVPEPIVSNIKQGCKVFIHNKEYKLTHIQKLVDPDTHMAPAFLNYGEIKALPGSNVDLDLVIQERQNALVIPYESVFMKNEKFCVYVVEKNKAKLKFIKVGIREKEKIEILSGLKQGEQVIVRGQTRLYPGISVKIYKA